MRCFCVDIFDKSNALGNLGFLFTLNQFLYILIVMWVFSAAPDRMVMVYAMVFGAHLLPYSWLYISISYCVFAIGIPILSLVLGCLYSSFAVATTMIIAEVIFVVLLFIENRWLCQSWLRPFALRFSQIAGCTRCYSLQDDGCTRTYILEDWTRPWSTRDIWILGVFGLW